MYNWVVRRKAFLVSRWLGAPISIANRATQVVKKLFCRDWDPLPDPDAASRPLLAGGVPPQRSHDLRRSEEHTSELQSLMRISYAVFCLKKKKKITRTTKHKKRQNKAHK